MFRWITIFLLLILNCNGTIHTGLSFNGLKTEKTKYDEYLIDRSNGLDRFTGTTVINSTLGTIKKEGREDSSCPYSSGAWKTYFSLPVKARKCHFKAIWRVQISKFSPRRQPWWRLE